MNRIIQNTFRHRSLFRRAYSDTPVPPAHIPTLALATHPETSNISTPLPPQSTGYATDHATDHVTGHARWTTGRGMFSFFHFSIFGTVTHP
ncbi:MAG: hypothetical protein LBM04_13950 [Opitutaceae bacterium]|nr:hypothetical protein [Opitutaceae bacterium]